MLVCMCMYMCICVYGCGYVCMGVGIAMAMAMAMDGCAKVPVIGMGMRAVYCVNFGSLFVCTSLMRVASLLFVVFKEMS